MESWKLAFLYFLGVVERPDAIGKLGNIKAHFRIYNKSTFRKKVIWSTCYCVAFGHIETIDCYTLEMVEVSTVST